MSFGLLAALIFGYFIVGTITLAVYHVITGYETGGVMIVLFWPVIWLIGIFIVVYKIAYRLATCVEEKWYGR